TFMEGALVLMIAGFLVKVIGAVFKIPLYNVIGGQAMAYFTVAYDVYVWMYIITTAGLPVAISRMVSESNARGEYNNARRILYVAFSAFLALGVVGCGILYFGAEELAAFMSNPSAVPAIKVIAPAILFEIVMSSYRGYYQGNQNMLPTAISQIIVAVAKLGGGIVAANYVLGLGLPESEALPLAAAAAISGVTLGTMLGSAYLVIRKFFFKPQKRMPEVKTIEPYGQVLRRLIMITVPIALGSMVSSVSNLVDTALIMRRLVQGAGFAQGAAETAFGAYSGMSRTMFNLPPSLIIPIGVSVIPAIAEQFTLARREEAAGVLTSALRVATLLALPAGLGLSFMAEPILTLLYSDRLDEVAIAAPTLTLLGFAVTFVCLDSITNSILQAIGRERVPVVTMLCGGIVKMCTTYLLVGIPGLNIMGAPFSTLLCYGTITTLNFKVLRREIGQFPSVVTLAARPALCAFLSCAAARLTWAVLVGALGNSLATVAGIGVAVVLYLSLVLFTKTLHRADVLLLPKGEKIAKLLENRGWMR
ncbi:MAG: polysaccharide biosynthesis protein, partial [Clostridia bacterium]|nr:polysaccharide biosynthesis protein [Clostridia bacterium]